MLIFNNILSFIKNKRKWSKRQRGAEYIIGRMYSISLSSDIETYCLRLLLLHKHGATSFDYLLTHDTIKYNSFKEAAQKHGYFNSEVTWDDTLSDAIVFNMPKQLRDLFAYICILASPPNISDLFYKYKEHLSEDYHGHNEHTDNCGHCINSALINIQETLSLHNRTCQDFDLPIPTNDLPHTESFDVFAEQEKATVMIASLNAKQQTAFNKIMASSNDNNLLQQCFFLDGPGGSGKTYRYKTILCKIRGESNIVLPVASTGIAANLLTGGRTYHSQFKLPIPLLDTSTSYMKLSSDDAAIIREAKLLIWDECTMAPSTALKAVDKLLKEIMQSSHPKFGNKTILLGR